jgi:hypothetical protein
LVESKQGDVKGANFVLQVSALLKKLQPLRPLELLASQERNEIDGSEGAIITSG